MSCSGDNPWGKLIQENRGYFMREDKTNSQKIRFKFANGEEFEAEGTLDFVERQRDYFLTLVKKKPLPPVTHPLHEDTSVSGPLAPRLYATAPGTYASGPVRESVAGNSPIPNTNASFSRTRVWEQLLKEEGDLLFLRRKFRLSADEGALLILGGAKTLLDQSACRALFLSKAMERSGFQITRLDRQLAPAVKLGYIRCEGAKRSRTYALTPAGLAHAFMLAQRKAADATLP